MEKKRGFSKLNCLVHSFFVFCTSLCCKFVLPNGRTCKSAGKKAPCGKERRHLWRFVRRIIEGCLRGPQGAFVASKKLSATGCSPHHWKLPPSPYQDLTQPLHKTYKPPFLNTSRASPKSYPALTQIFHNSYQDTSLLRSDTNRTKITQPLTKSYPTLIAIPSSPYYNPTQTLPKSYPTSYPNHTQNPPKSYRTQLNSYAALTKGPPSSYQNHTQALAENHSIPIKMRSIRRPNRIHPLPKFLPKPSEIIANTYKVFPNSYQNRNLQWIWVAAGLGGAASQPRMPITRGNYVVRFSKAARMKGLAEFFLIWSVVFHGMLLGFATSPTISPPTPPLIPLIPLICLTPSRASSLHHSAHPPPFPSIPRHINCPGSLNLSYVRTNHHPSCI